MNTTEHNTRFSWLMLITIEIKELSEVVKSNSLNWNCCKQKFQKKKKWQKSKKKYKNSKKILGQKKQKKNWKKPKKNEKSKEKFTKNPKKCYVIKTKYFHYKRRNIEVNILPSILQSKKKLSIWSTFENFDRVYENRSLVKMNTRIELPFSNQTSIFDIWLHGRNCCILKMSIEHLHLHPRCYPWHLNRSTPHIKGIITLFLLLRFWFHRL